MKNLKLKRFGLLCWNKLASLTNQVWESQNNSEVDQSGQEGYAEMYGHQTVFDRGRSSLNEEGNNVADTTPMSLFGHTMRHPRVTMTVSYEQYFRI